MTNNEQRRSKRERGAIDYAAIEEGIVIPVTSEFYFMDGDADDSPARRWITVVKGNNFIPYEIQRQIGTTLTLPWAKVNGFFEPLVVSSQFGLGLVVPDSSLSPRTICEIVGAHVQANVFDVSSQKQIPGWTFGKWLEYNESTSYRRSQLYSGQGPLSVDALDISSTPLQTMVVAPKIVRSLDWMANTYPRENRTLTEFQSSAPTCFILARGSFLNFQIEPLGASSWCHVSLGSLVLLLIPPTDANLSRFEAWGISPLKQSLFFGDMADKCFKVEIKMGETVFLPCGWIVAKYTPVDTVGFKGRFLHNLAVQGQVKCCDILERIEDKISESAKHRPPKSQSLIAAMWNAAAFNFRALTAYQDRNRSKHQYANDEDTDQISRTAVSALEKKELFALISHLRRSSDSQLPCSQPISVPASGPVSHANNKLTLKLSVKSVSSSIHPSLVAAESCQLGSGAELLNELEKLVLSQNEEYVNDSKKGPVIPLSSQNCTSSISHPVESGNVLSAAQVALTANSVSRPGSSIQNDNQCDEEELEDSVVQNQEESIPKFRLKLKSSGVGQEEGAVPAKKTALKLKLTSQKIVDHRNNEDEEAVEEDEEEDDDDDEGDMETQGSEKLRLRLPSKPTHRKREDISCCVVGCSVVDTVAIQVSVPHWERQVNGVLTGREVESNKTAAYANFPNTWNFTSKKRKDSAETESVEIENDPLFPLCNRHEEERYHWRLSKEAPGRYSQVLDKLSSLVSSSPDGVMKKRPKVTTTTKKLSSTKSSASASSDSRGTASASNINKSISKVAAPAVKKTKRDSLRDILKKGRR